MGSSKLNWKLNKRKKFKNLPCPFCGCEMDESKKQNTNSITIEHLFVKLNPIRGSKLYNRISPKVTCCCKKCNELRGHKERKRIKELIQFYKYPSRIPMHLLNVNQFNLFYNY